MPLDPAQRAVVALAPTASGVVVGAPGSGKTTAVVARVRALLEAGLAPDEVLVLTPTRQAATVLRDRLALEVRVATPGPLARSLAAVAYQLVRANAVHAGLPQPQLLTGGGPSDATTTLPVLIYVTAFTKYRLSQAAAISVVSGLLLLVFALLFIRFMAPKQEDAQ